ncbi:MAG: polysaccharide biosynthesis protein, partial [Luminiphilus sp.]
GTGHPMILRAEEGSVEFDVIESATEELIEACSQLDCSAISEVLRGHVMGFEAHEVRHDHVWLKQGRIGKRAVVRDVPENVTPFPANAAGRSTPSG